MIKGCQEALRYGLAANLDKGLSKQEITEIESEIEKVLSQAKFTIEKKHCGKVQFIGGITVESFRYKKIKDSKYGTDGESLLYYESRNTKLTPTEYAFMEPLIKKPGKWLTLKEIAEKGNYKVDIDDIDNTASRHRTDVLLGTIRKKLQTLTQKNGLEVLRQKNGKYMFDIYL